MSFFYYVDSTHVLSEDTISREVKNGKLYSKRLLTKTNGVPKWGEMLVKKKSVKIVEESILDPEARTLTTYTRNFTYNKAMVVIANRIRCIKVKFSSLS